MHYQAIKSKYYIKYLFIFTLKIKLSSFLFDIFLWAEEYIIWCQKNNLTNYPGNCKMYPKIIIHAYYSLLLFISQNTVSPEIWKLQNQWCQHTLLRNESYTFGNSFWTLGNMKMRFGQILAHLMTNISTILLVQFWGLKPCCIALWF